MRSSMFLSSLASVLGAIALVAACTTTTTTVVDGSDASTTSGDAGKKDGSTTSSSGGDDASVDEPTGDEACGAEATQDACFTCCAQNYQKGTQFLLSATIACGCQGTGSAVDAGAGQGPCATACAATICAATPKNPDQACNTCLQNALAQNGACYQSVGDACLKNTDCAAQQGCLQKQCASKK